MSKVKLVAIAGSTRSGSTNKKVLAHAIAGAEAAGAEVQLADLRELAMPLYDGDLEEKEGLPDGAKKLRAMLKDAQGLLIASPEYNSSISGVLKNAIDWASRPTPTEPMVMYFAGRVAGLMSASPSPLGGLRGLVHVRSILGNIQVLVVPDQVTVASAYQAFGEDGRLTDAKLAARVEALGAKVADVARRLAGAS